MTATNETTNYKLPLFTDDDQPTWLGDFNGAMSKIDSDMNTVGANASTALSAANNAVSRVATVENTMDNAQATANSAYELAQTVEGNISGIDAKVDELKSKFPIHTADIATAAVTADKLDETAITAMWKSQRVYRFDSMDSTADNTGMTGPNNYACRGFYMADLQLLIILGGLLDRGTPQGASITLPRYVPIAPRDIRATVGCLEWNDENFFYSWDGVMLKGGTRELVFNGRESYETTKSDIIGTLMFFLGTGTSDNTNAVAYANANGTFAL